MRVTEILTVDYVDCTPEQPFQLAWLNSLGGVDTWVFQRHQEYKLDAKDMDEFMPVINYLQVSNGRQRVLKKDAYMMVRLGYEQLSKQQVVGIKELLISPCVKWIDGTNETVVVVKDGSFDIYDTGESKFNLEFDIVMPKLYTNSF
jgi:hypothetical protein